MKRLKIIAICILIEILCISQLSSLASKGKIDNSNNENSINVENEVQEKENNDNESHDENMENEIKENNTEEINQNEKKSENRSNASEKNFEETEKDDPSDTKEITIKDVEESKSKSIDNKKSATSIATKKTIEQIEDGEYEIRTAANNNRILDIGGGSIENGAKFQIWDDADVFQQRFYIKHIQNNYYSIKVRKSKKMMDVQGGSKNAGTPVHQFTANNTDAQRWIIYRTSDGYYKFASQCNGLFLEYGDKAASCGARVFVNNENDEITQKFVLDKVLKDKGARTIEDGEYEIRCSYSEENVFDIGGASVAPGAKLQMWDDVDVLQQRFVINYLNNGYYHITVRKSGKLLGVPNSSIKNKTDVEQLDYNGSEAFQWIIKDAGDGYYNIISRCNGLYMQIANQNNTCGSPIFVNSPNNLNTQKFKFDKVLKDKGVRTIEDGEYEIRSCLNQNKVIDIGGGSLLTGARIQLWTKAGVSQQRFYVKYIDNGYYSIIAKNSNKAIDVPGASIKESVQLQQYSSNGTDAQRWIIKDMGDGKYCIISKCSGLYIDVAGGVASNGAKIVQMKPSGNTSQMFYFEKYENITGTKTINDGVYEIKTSLNHRVFDIDAGSWNNGAKVQLWDDADVIQQRFKIEYMGDGCYSIISANSKKSIDVPGCSLQEGIALQQFDYNGTDAQKWIIKDIGNGKYNIIAKYSGLYVSLSDPNAANGTTLMMKKKGSAEQTFEFTKINEKTGIDVSSYQGSIDWAAVKKSGVEFAMIRVGYRGYGTGKLKYDSCFTYNIENATKNDIKCGVYFYSQAISESEAIEEANYVIEAIKKYKITYPVVFDSEYSSSNRTGRADYLDKNTRTKICKAFCNRIALYGYTPMVYASKYWFYDDLNLNELGQYKKWVAHYTSGAPANKTDYKYDYYMWQYTDKGSVNGISGPVDMDIQY